MGLTPKVSLLWVLTRLSYRGKLQEEIVTRDPASPPGASTCGMSTKALSRTWEILMPAGGRPAVVCGSSDAERHHLRRFPLVTGRRLDGRANRAARHLTTAAEILRSSVRFATNEVVEFGQCFSHFSLVGVGREQVDDCVARFEEAEHARRISYTHPCMPE